MSWPVGVISLPKTPSNTFWQNTKKPLFATFTNLLEFIFLPQPLLTPLSHLDTFLPEEAMWRKEGITFVLSGQQLPFSLPASLSPLCTPEHPRLFPGFAPFHCSLQTEKDARATRKTRGCRPKSRSGAPARAPTVDTAPPDRLVPSHRAS